MNQFKLILGICLCLLLLNQKVKADNNTVDSLKNVVKLSDDDNEIFEALFQLYTDLAKTNPEKSQEYALEAKALAIKMNNEVFEARIEKELAKKYFMAYQFEKYDSVILGLSKIFLQHNEMKMYGNCINNLGSSQYYRGNLVQAEKYYREAMNIYDPNEWLYASTGLNIVAIMQTQGRYSESLKLLLPLIEKFHEFGDNYNYANCLVYMANVYKNQGNNEKAKEYNLLFVEKNKEIDYKYGIAGGLLNLAQIYYDENDLDKALEYALKSKETFESISKEYELTNNLIFIGVIYKDLKQYNQAQLFNQRALEIAEKNGYSNYLSEIYNNMSNLNLENKRYKEAIQVALKSYGIAKQIKSYKMIRDAAYSMYEAYKGLLDFPNALRYYETHTQYKDSVDYEQHSHEIQNLKTNFEIITAEFENEKLVDENRLNKLEIKQQKSKLFFIGIVLFFVLIIVAVLSILYRKLKNKNRLILEQQEDLRKANALKDNLFSIIAHDLRGPVGNVRGLLDFLEYDKEDGNKESFDKILNTVKNAASSTYRLLENLLTWARQQKQEISFNPQNQNISELVKEAIQLKIPAAQQKDIKLNFNIEKELQCCCDYDMIQLVVRNLIDNAIKFTPSGGTVDVKGIMSDQQVEVSVIDSGIGIGEDAREKIFDKYQHYTTRGTKNENGSGLGLKLCYEFIHNHSGNVWVESAEGKGSKFIFAIPVS